MYYNDYEEYMRNVLGYNNTYPSYNNDCNCNYMNYNCPYNFDCNMQTNMMQDRNNCSSNIEQMYPEIYKIINPMVCRMCDSNQRPITEYLIEQMTDEIYDKAKDYAEIKNVINLNIGTRNTDSESITKEENRKDECSSQISSNGNRSSTSSCSNNCSKISSNSTSGCVKTEEIKQETREDRSPRPQNRNRLLRDLIRILIINRFIRPGRPNRPPFMPGQKPGMPGMLGPGIPRPRPPMPRVDNDYETYM